MGDRFAVGRGNGGEEKGNGGEGQGGREGEGRLTLMCSWNLEQGRPLAKAAVTNTKSRRDVRSGRCLLCGLRSASKIKLILLICHII